MINQPKEKKQDDNKSCLKYVIIKGQDNKQDWEEKIYRWFHYQDIHIHSDRIKPLLDTVHSLLEQTREEVKREAVEEITHGINYFNSECPCCMSNLKVIEQLLGISKTK